jgi:hypothetical protein
MELPILPRLPGELKAITFGDDVCWAVPTRPTGSIHGATHLASSPGAPRVIKADYAADYVYLAQMEPLAAVAAVDADGKGAEIWLGTQSQTVSLGVLQHGC